MNKKRVWREDVIERLREELRRLLPVDKASNVGLLGVTPPYDDSLDPGSICWQGLDDLFPLMYAHQALVNPCVDNTDRFVFHFMKQACDGVAHPLMQQTAAVLLREALRPAMLGLFVGKKRSTEERYKKIANALGLGGFAGERSSAKARPTRWTLYEPELQEMGELIKQGASFDAAYEAIKENYGTARRHEAVQSFFEFDRDTTVKRWLSDYNSSTDELLIAVIKDIYNADILVGATQPSQPPSD